MLYIGKAQEKARVQRTERRCDPATGATYAWVVDSTAMVNHYYFYAVDDDFGPFFLKFCSYFPYNAKLCINGHGYLKRQLAKRGIGFEPLDNGILQCDDPERMQRLADGLTASLASCWLCCRTRSRPATGSRASATTSRCCRPVPPAAGRRPRCARIRFFVEVTLDASFVDDLGADSLDMVELVMAFEEESGLEVPDEEAEKITRVKEASTTSSPRSGCWLADWCPLSMVFQICCQREVLLPQRYFGKVKM